MMTTLNLPGFVTTFLAVMAALLVFAVGVGILLIAILYLIDITQTQHAIRRNFPVIGRLRYRMEHLGVFFRQYFYAMDREEMPFNRAQRTWVYRAAKNLENTQPFGSTRDLRPLGTLLFANATFPALETAANPVPPLVIGPDCAQPYHAGSFFNLSAMSYGAISQAAVRALSHGARLAGCWMNTGEGGLSPYHLAGGADLVFQIGTAKYGVCDSQGGLDEARLRDVAAHPEVKLFEIKLSQGAKPGKGGILPGAKVTPEIAAIRGIPVGQDSRSPNRHPEIADTAALLAFVHRVRTLTGKPTGFKLVIGDPLWLDELCQEIVREGIASAPDFITVDSADGGTGAAPMSLLDYVGLPLSESLPLVVDKLIEYGLRERIRVIASGKLINPGEVAWALCVGADFINSARGFLFALGCVQSMQCDKNTCPAGIATHNPRLQRGLDPEDKAERVRHYVENLRHEVAIIAHACGAADPRELRREHCRIVIGPGCSASLSELYRREKMPEL
ncbi:MAG: FMN-binding glutamate synthase family protein [Candidatus Contendobacter sp.]|nr:FMN-binding glutamate synthase family protein [Candidatus Contendobacter sp.]